MSVSLPNFDINNIFSQDQSRLKYFLTKSKKIAILFNRKREKNTCHKMEKNGKDNVHVKGTTKNSLLVPCCEYNENNNLIKNKFKKGKQSFTYEHEIFLKW